MNDIILNAFADELEKQAQYPALAAIRGGLMRGVDAARLSGSEIIRRLQARYPALARSQPQTQHRIGGAALAGLGIGGLGLAAAAPAAHDLVLAGGDGRAAEVPEWYSKGVFWPHRKLPSEIYEPTRDLVEGPGAAGAIGLDALLRGPAYGEHGASYRRLSREE